MSRKQAVIELFIAAILWGGSFVTAKWAVDGFGFSWVACLRFLLAAVICLPLMLRWRKQNRGIPFWESDAGLSVYAGVFLSAALLLQHAGLRYTTVTKNSFITTLYIVLIPLFEFFMTRKRISPLLFVYIAIALVGAAMVCRVTFGGLNVGDVLTFLCAIASAFQIIYIGKVSAKIRDPFQYNVYQALWGGLFALPFALYHWPMPMPSALPWASLVFLAVGVTLLAFTIQVRTQRVLPASTVSMFFLLESPFAALLAWPALGEIMTWDQALGGLLILIAAFGTLRL